jgi:acetaldehyde dehydrogenase
LARARKLGVATTHEGLDGLTKMPEFNDIELVFDATSAKAHAYHHKVLTQYGKKIVDMTPAAIGDYYVPTVTDAKQIVEQNNVNMVTCGGQATIPMVAAISQITPVRYAEIVASIASKSAGPGTRANIDEFTETTSLAIEKVGGAEKGKAIIVLNPAEPPLLMRDTVFCLVDLDADTQAIEKSIKEKVEVVQSYVPGYRLKQEVQFEKFDETNPLDVPAKEGSANRSMTGIKVTIFLEVEGAAHYLPAYAGNLDIMTAAALRTGEQILSAS